MEGHNQGTTLEIISEKYVHIFKLSCNATKEVTEGMRANLTQQINEGLVLLSSIVSYEGSFMK